MARIQSRSSTRKKRRERRHVLSVNVLTPRIIFHSLLRKSRFLFIYSLVTLSLVFLTWGIFKGARHLFVEGERFQLTEVSISPTPHATSFINYSTLSRITGFQNGESIFSYDLADMKKALEELPEVKEVSLTRRLPGTVLVSLEEYQPVAKVDVSGDLYVVDKEGFCFRSSLATSGLLQSLPRVIPLYSHDVTSEKKTQYLTDIGLQRAINLISSWKEFHVDEQPLSVEVKDYHSLEMLTETGTRLLFGYYEHERQIQDFLSIKSYSLNTGQAVSAANLLPYKNIPVTFTKTQQRTLPAGKPTLFKAPVRTRSKNHPTVEEDVLLILEQG